MCNPFNILADGGLMHIFSVFVLPMTAFMLLAYGVYNVAMSLRTDTRKKVVDRLKNDGQRRSKQNEQTQFEDFRRQTVEATGTLAKTLSQFSFTERLQRMLEQANLAWSAPQLLVNLTTIAAVAAAILLTLQLGFLVAGGAAVAVFVLPIFVLNMRRKRRLNKLMNQLPDVFELLSQALRAGNSLASGMQLVAKELPDPAGTEFGRVFHEQNLGLKIEDSLRNMAERVDVLDVRFFVTAVLIQRQVGGDLAEVLDKISSVIRERIVLFGTVQALTAEGRLSGYVLLGLPVLVFIVLSQINPGYLGMLFTDPTGKMMLMSAITMQFMGWAMIRKIVNIKV